MNQIKMLLHLQLLLIGNCVIEKKTFEMCLNLHTVQTCKKNDTFDQNCFVIKNLYLSRPTTDVAIHTII